MERKIFSRNKNNENNKKPVQCLFTTHIENAKRSRNKILIDSNKETIDTEHNMKKTTVDSISPFKTISINQSYTLSNINSNKKLSKSKKEKIERKKFSKKIIDLVNEMSRRRDKSENFIEGLNKIPNLKQINNESYDNRKFILKTSRGYRNTPNIFFQKEDIIKSTLKENIKFQNQPTSNLELNNILINGFGLNGSINPASINFSKKLSQISEKYFNILESMKRKRTKIQLENFEKIKQALDNQVNIKKSKEIQILSNMYKDDKWVKKFFQSQYNNDKISNSDFENFKNNEILKLKKKFKENSEKFADLICKMDSEPYEVKKEDEKNFDSSKEPISFKNLQRVVRVKGIRKTGKDYENNDFGLEVNAKLKQEADENEDFLTLTIEQLGPPKFIKTVFKSTTLRKFQIVSGNLFGS